MTVQELITKLSHLPAAAPVGVVTPDSAGGYDLESVKYNGEYVILTGGVNA